MRSNHWPRAYSTDGVTSRVAQPGSPAGAERSTFGSTSTPIVVCLLLIQSRVNSVHNCVLVCACAVHGASIAANRAPAAKTRRRDRPGILTRSLLSLPFTSAMLVKRTENDDGRG